MTSKRNREYDAWVKQCLKLYGWYTHHASEDDPQTPTGVNSHTHGFPEKYGINDLQIVAPVDSKVVNDLFHAIADLLDAGKLGRVEPGKKYYGWSAVNTDSTPLAFHPARECGRDVWRVILPDKQMRCLKDESMDLPWSMQYLKASEESEY